MTQSACKLRLCIAVVLGAAVVIVLAAPLWFGVAQTGSNPAVAAGGAANQGQPVAKLPEWDVVSVKQADPNQCNTEGSGLMPTPDGMHIFCVLALNVIQQAYGIDEPSRIAGAPEWTLSGPRWSIDAKVAGEDAAAYGKLSRKGRNRMLQELMADRFHLKAHMEKREMPVYELVVAKGGPKLKEATAETGPARITGKTGKVESFDMRLSALPPFLNNEAGHPVIDKTGLTGKYDFTLEYLPAARAATDETGGPSIFTALEEQLGLKLEPAKAQMDVLVIDSIEQPAPN